MGNRFLILVTMLASLPVLVGSDLAKLSRSRSREEAHRKAMGFVEEMRQRDPYYYPVRHGLRTFSCRPRVSLTDWLFSEAKRMDPGHIQSQDWAMDYYWEAPGRSYLSSPPWRRDLSGEVSRDLDIYCQMVDGVMEGLVRLAPYRYELLFLEYERTPGGLHHLHGIPRDSNARNACLDYFFDPEYRLRSLNGNARLYKFTRSEYKYEETPQGLVCTGFRHLSVGSGKSVVVDIKYARIGGFRLVRSVLLDLPDTQDTEARKILPIRIEIGDIRLNPAVPEDIRVQMQESDW